MLPDGVENTTKRRRLPGACDLCKKKKIKCDFSEKMGRPCTNCETARNHCTHKTGTKPYGSKGYVESLEIHLEKMERVLTMIFPGVDLNTDLERLAAGSASESAGNPPSATTESSEPGTALIPRNDEGDETVKNIDHIAFKMKNLKLDPSEGRFFGKSSGFQMVQTALNIKREQVGHHNENYGKPSRSSRRQEFWEAPWWESGIMNQVREPDPSAFEYPEEDLLWSLIDLYFYEVNILFPLLHRPTFERQIAEGKHLKDLMFGNTVLLVCALGAKFSDDPRVVVEGSGTTRSAGYKWYMQGDFGKRAFEKRPSLHELQMYALIVLFCRSNTRSHGVWIHTGLGTKMAMEVGAHRRRREKDGPHSLEDELWKRAFWTLFALDTVVSAVSGRPCSLQEEDYDQEYPADCDEEAWNHPNPLRQLQQSSHRRSGMSYFTCYVTLMEILAKVMRFLYSVRRPRDLLERAGLKFDQQSIAELDSTMNKWLDCIPDHLRWNPDCKNQLFLKQSALLHATYYQVQICIHRPFIPSLRNPSAITFPSSTICSNAARSCCYILDALNRSAISPAPHLQSISVIAALILLVNIFNGKHFGAAQNVRKDREHIQKIIDMLGACEHRWSSAGRYRDILTELALPNGCNKQKGYALNREAMPSEDLLLRPPFTSPTCGVPDNIYCIETTAEQNENSNIFLTGPTTADMGVGVNIEDSARLASEIEVPPPLYVGGSGQSSAYAPFEVLPISITPGDGLSVNDGIQISKHQPIGYEVFPHSGIPHENTFQGQASLPDAVGESAYSTQAVVPEAMSLGQGASHSGLGMESEWQDQERVMQILQMMDGGRMDNWVGGNDLSRFQGDWKSYSINSRGHQP